jgi:hypothetical protein
MAHYAQIIENKVKQIIVLKDNDTKTLQSLKNVHGGEWIKTSYNTRGGVHYDKNNKPDGGLALRYNFACIDCAYDSEADAFYDDKQPFPSWTLSKETYLWNAPVPMPTNIVVLNWNEETKSWITQPSPYPSWICVNNTWQPPIPKPEKIGWDWDEEDKIWYKANPLVPDAEEEQ